jgi:NAD(P)-dependent dehydrogenase (short-subunit alcohol dehydrogenase family)
VSEFRERIALVTGGGRALGRCIAITLAQAGIDIAVVGPDEDELNATAGEIQQLGRRSIPIVMDVSEEEQVMHAIETARDTLGPIEILVNNAGIIGPTAPVHEITRQQWDEVLAVNLTGAFMCSAAVIPEMIENRRGKIVNISSIAGKIGYALRSPYAVSKWGLIGLTQTLAKELGPYDIQVNCICPGPINGQRMANVIRQRAEELGQTVEQVHQQYVESAALGRMVEQSDVAEMVAYLVSDRAKNITGQAIDVSAGFQL